MYNCTHPNSCNSQNIDFFMYLGKFFFDCFPSCKKSCLLVLSFVQKIVV